MIRRWKTLTSSERGATVMEFGIVAPVLMLMLMGFFDAGRAYYVRSVLQGALQKAGRDGTLEGSSSTTQNSNVESQVRPVAGTGAAFGYNWKNYSTFSQVEQPEPYVDANDNDQYDVGECFEDENANTTWDADVGRTGIGGASDIVLYTATVTYPRIFPLSGMLGWSANQQVSASTVLRNQPYGEQVIPTVTECP